MIENKQVFFIEGGILKRYTGPGGDVAVPEGVARIGVNAFRHCAGLTGVTIPEGVAKIGWGAFWGCAGLTAVTLPGSAAEIGTRAFCGCTGLTSVVIPEGVARIGINTFRDCTSLTSVTIPASVTGIGILAFMGCTGLTHIHVDAGNPVYRSIDGLLLEQDGDDLVLIRCPQGRTGALTVPEGITKIGADAFRDCAGLNSVTILEGVACIGYMDGSSEDLASSIPGETFRRCCHLKDVFLPASAMRIAPGTFSDCGRGEYVTHTLTIHAPAGSCAEKYAGDHGHNFMPTCKKGASTRPGRMPSQLIQRPWQDLRRSPDDDAFGENETD